MSHEPIQADAAGNVTKFGDDGGLFKSALRAFLVGLDTNDRERLHAAGMAAFDQYVTELPGPDALVKKMGRPAVEVALTNFINDWTQ